MKRPSLSRRTLGMIVAAIAAFTGSTALYSCKNDTPAEETEQREMQAIPAAEETEQHEMQAIRRVVFADGRLWLLHDDGSLAAVGPNSEKPERVATNGRVVEICNSQGSLIAIVADGRDQWTLQQRSPQRWTLWASVPIEGDRLAAIGCKRDEAGVALVTDRRLLEVDGKEIRSVRLKQQLEPPSANGTALVAEDRVWVGFNVGEWGGGLRRISRSDGTVETIERNRSGDLCGGPLNTDCDPVHAIVTAPWNSSCVVAAIGLEHMGAHGRIVEVCAREIRRLYFKPLDPQPPNNFLDEGEPSSTVPFFGLARAGTALWAIGRDGLYRFDGRGAPRFRPLPKFENRGGYWVNFDLPGIVLVRTDVNQSGSAPMMAVR